MSALRDCAVSTVLVAVLFGAGVTIPGCSSEESAATITRASIRGTVLDRATGVVVAGARIELTDGRSTASAEDGRFELGDLEPGLVGELRARTPDGRTALLPIRPLRAGALEVVLHVGP
jgi:hypothetical protein